MIAHEEGAGVVVDGRAEGLAPGTLDADVEDFLVQLGVVFEEVAEDFADGLGVPSFHGLFG